MQSNGAPAGRSGGVSGVPFPPLPTAQQAAAAAAAAAQAAAQQQQQAQAAARAAAARQPGGLPPPPPRHAPVPSQAPPPKHFPGPPQMRPLRDVLRAHVAEHGAVLTWRRRVGAEHAAAAERAEDEALTRYCRNASLLEAIFTDTPHAQLPYLAAGGSAAEDRAAVAALRDELEARYGSGTAQAGGDAMDTGDEAHAPADDVEQGSAAAETRMKALQRYLLATKASTSFPMLSAALAEYEAAVGVGVQLPPAVERMLRLTAPGAPVPAPAEAEAAAAAVHAAAAAEPGADAPRALGLATLLPPAQRISADELEAVLAAAPDRGAIAL